MPFIVVLLEAFFGLSSYIGDRNVVLCLALATWMVLWWVFEILPLGITSLTPLFFLPFFNVMPIKQVSPHYANPMIFLFVGGFIIARALEKTQLDERIALNILRVIGRSDFGIVLGFVIATSFLSMWISNTATTVMMVPIALSVIHFLKGHLKGEAKAGLPQMQVVLFLAIAYSANIGGIMTPIGTPPNVVFLGYLNDMYNRQVDFWRWILVAAPVALFLLTTMLVLLQFLYPYKVAIPKKFSQFIKGELKGLGKMERPQFITIAVFLLAASLWIFKDLIHYLVDSKFLNDTSIAIFAGVLLFFIPTQLRKGWKPVLVADDISRLPWNIVLLFGGGMALAGALQKVGLIQVATDFFTDLNFANPYWLIFVLAALSLLLTEIMSNVALCVVALPMIMKLGEAQGIDPLLIAMPAALCSSFAFSMPVSTPPNAIVFGTNALTVKQMLRAGVLLNAIAIVVTMTVGFGLMQRLLVIN